MSISDSPASSICMFALHHQNPDASSMSAPVPALDAGLYGQPMGYPKTPDGRSMEQVMGFVPYSSSGTERAAQQSQQVTRTIVCVLQDLSAIVCFLQDLSAIVCFLQDVSAVVCFLKDVSAVVCFLQDVSAIVCFLQDLSAIVCFLQDLSAIVCFLQDLSAIVCVLQDLSAIVCFP